MGNATYRRPKHPGEIKYNEFVAKLEEIEEQLLEERNEGRFDPHGDIFITDPSSDWENTADSHDWQTGEPLVEDTDAWWDMMYAQAVSAAAARMEQMGLNLNDHFPKPVY